MNGVIWAALALLVSVPSFAWAQQASGTAAAKPAAPAAKGADKSAPRKPAAAKPAAAKASPAAKPAKPPANAPARALARRTKSVFVFAANSCHQSKKTCDTALLEDAEVRFMDACGACAPFERCEQERDAIRAGKGRASRDPCAP